MKPYANNLEHLLEELSRIDMLIKTYLDSLSEDLPDIMDEFRGLYVSEAEIQTIQKNQKFEEKQELFLDDRNERLEEINKKRKVIDLRIEESLKISRELRLHELSKLFDLDPYEREILLIGLAPELDLKYEKLYSYLQNDITKKKPTINLALNLLFPTIEEKVKSRIYFSPAAPLQKNKLIHLLEGEANASLSLISSFIKIDERVVNFLLGFDEPDPRIQKFCYLLRPQRSMEDLVLPEDLKSKLMNVASLYRERNYPPKLIFCGPSGSGKKTAAEAICRIIGVNLLLVESNKLA